MKLNILNSKFKLKSRIFLIAEDASAIEESYQTPNRIHINLCRDSTESKKKRSDFLICDYVFPDETFVDISDRIRELFDYEIKDNEKIVFVENLPRK